MRRIILTEKTHITPFNEPARDLRVQNKPLWLWQRDILVKYATEEREYANWQMAHKFETESIESFVHRDNLFFNELLVDEFISRARAGRRPVRLAFRADDPAIATHVVPMTHTLFQQGDLYLADVWYLPKGISQSVEAEPLIIETEPQEVGYYYVPQYMANEFGDLVYQIPKKSFVLIETWVHLFIADILFGVFARGVNRQEKINAEWQYKLKLLSRSILEQKQMRANSEMVQIGNNVSIDPSAIVLGPTTIGDNVEIGAGAVVDNCIIGSNVTVSQGCQLMLSVVSDNCFLPFRSSLFMTSMMEYTMVAQNTCLQLCVVGRNTFIGAGSTFTDFNILGGSLKTQTSLGLEETNLSVLGGCVGHNCRLSAGVIVYPARTIESDVVLLATDDRKFVTHNISYEQSDHHPHADKYYYPRLYPREDEELF